MGHDDASWSMKASLCEPGVSGADRTPDQRPVATPSRGVRHYPRRRIRRKSNLFTRPPPVPPYSKSGKQCQSESRCVTCWQPVPSL